MSLSITCIEQQQKDKQTVKKIVIYGLLCSTILHAAVLILAISGMLDRPLEQQEEDAIELIFVEEPEETPPEPEIEEKVEEPKPEEIVEEQEVIPPEPLETAIAQPQEIVPPEIPTETAISEAVESSSPEQPTETALEPIEQPQQLEPIPEPEPVAEEPIAQPNPSSAAFSPDSITEVQPDSASTPETSDSFSSPIAANIPPEVPKPEVAEVTQPSFEEPSSNLSSSVREQSNFEDVSSNISSPQTSLSSPIETERSAPTKPSAVGTQPSVSESNSPLNSSVNEQSNFEDVSSNISSPQTSLSSPIETERSVPTKPSAVGTQPSVSQSNSNLGSSLSEQSSFGDVARNSTNPGSSNGQFGAPLSSDTTGEGSRPSLPGEVGTQPTASGQSNLGSSLSEQGSFGDVARNSTNPGSSNGQFGAPLSSDTTGEGSRPSLPGEVGTQPTASGQSNSGIGDALSGLGNFEDGTGRNSGNPGSGELAAVGSPLGGSGDSRGRPGKPSSGSGDGFYSSREYCIKCPDPNYPEEAKEQGLEGNPKLRFDIDSDGNTTNVTLEKSSGHPILDEAAIQQVKKWKFDSTKVGGRLRVLVMLTFNLEDL